MISNNNFFLSRKIKYCAVLSYRLMLKQHFIVFYTSFSVLNAITHWITTGCTILYLIKFLSLFYLTSSLINSFEDKITVNTGIIPLQLFTRICTPYVLYLMKYSFQVTNCCFTWINHSLDMKGSITLSLSCLSLSFSSFFFFFTIIRSAP